MSQRFVQNPWLSEVIATTDATLTSSAGTAFQPPANSAGVCEMRFIGRNTTTGTSVTWRAEAPWKNVAGTLTVGALLNIGGAALVNVGPSAADVTAFIGTVVSVIASGTTIQPKVQGLVATNIEWLLHAKYDAN